jgi:hypothetical protein
VREPPNDDPLRKNPTDNVILQEAPWRR